MVFQFLHLKAEKKRKNGLNTELDKWKKTVHPTEFASQYRTLSLNGLISAKFKHNGAQRLESEKDEREKKTRV